MNIRERLNPVPGFSVEALRSVLSPESFFLRVDNLIWNETSFYGESRTLDGFSGDN